MKSSNLYISFIMKCFEVFAIKLDQPVGKDLSPFSFLKNSKILITVMIRETGMQIMMVNFF